MLNVETPVVIIAGNGTRGPWPVSNGATITYRSKSHFRVERYASSVATPTVLVLGTDYDFNVSDVETGDPAATITLDLTEPVLAVGAYLRIIRITPNSQDGELPRAGGFSGPAMEGYLDQIARQVQDISARLALVVQLHGLSSGVSPQMPAPSPSKLIGWNSGGTGLQNVEQNEVGSGLVGQYSANGGETTVTVSENVAQAWLVELFINGVRQIPGVDYTASGTNVLTLDGALSAPDEVFWIHSGLTRATSTWRSGSGAPSNGLGSDGDMYFRADTNQVYGPKGGGVWGAAVSTLQGGDDGAQGPAGVAGPQGAAGANGVNGAPGAAGANGQDALGFIGEPFQPGHVGGAADFVIRLDMTSEFATNVGEIFISGTRFNHPDGVERAVTPGTILTQYGEGVAGRFFLMYTATAKATRFGTLGSQGSHANICAVRIKSGGGWEAFDDANLGQTFTPLATDCILAVVEAETTSSGLTAISPFVSGAVGLDGAPGADGAAGAPGQNVARVRIYRRATSTPTLPSATVTYTFATGLTEGLNNSWTVMVPSGTDPLYISEASAISSNATDQIAAGEWAAPVILVSNGAAGAAGSNGVSGAHVVLYQRTATDSAPGAPGSTLTYTFATGVVSGALGAWSQTIPAEAAGAYLWVTTATALGVGATDDIATGEWAAVRRLGADGQTVTRVRIYRRATSLPDLPSATATVTLATGAISGLNNGWTATVPAGADPLYVSEATAAAAVGQTTDTIAAGEWASAQILVQNGAAGATGAAGAAGANGSNGSNGADGINSATVFLYQRNDTGIAPARPTASLTYTFATALLSGGSLSGWSQSVPSESGGAYLYVTTATALSATATDSIAAGEWATVRTLAQDGTDGAQGPAGSNGANGRDAVVFQQDATPGSPVTGDTWVTVTEPRIWRRWNGSTWVPLLGNVAGYDAIGAALIAVVSLSAISANLGAITGGSINIGSGKFLVDASGNVTIRNAATGQRLVIGNSTLEVYDGANVRRVRLGLW